MTTLALESPAPVGNFASLRKQAAFRFFLLAGSPLFIWVLAQIQWPVQTAAQLIKAVTYWVMQFELWLSAPVISVPLMAGAAVFWLALTTQSVLSLAELDSTAEPNGETVAKAIAIYQRGQLVEVTLFNAGLGAVALALLSLFAKFVHGVYVNEELTLFLALGLIFIGLMLISPLLNVVLPKALRQPWHTEKGESRAMDALMFFSDTPWSSGSGSTSWSLSQYRMVLLYNLARRAGALDQVRQALGLEKVPTYKVEESPN